MATRVASILAEVGIDGSKFSSGVRGILGGIDQMLGGFGKINPMLAVTGAAFMAIIDFTKKVVAETEAYVTSITDLSRSLGMSTEETSRLVQASDDLFLSQEALSAGLKAGLRQGIDVSIDGLKKLSDQYLALEPGAERSAYLIKTFGRNGLDMGKLMEVGADGIQSATDAISKNLIVTEQSRINILNYKRSVDNLQDSWQGFKYTIGNEVIPQLDLLMRVMTRGKDEVEIHEQAVNALENRMSKLAGAAAFGNKAAAAALAELEIEYQKLIAVGPNLDEQLNIEQLALERVTDSFGELNEKMIFNYATAGLDSDAALEVARAMGLIDEQTYNAIGALQTANEQFKQTGDIDALTSKAAALAAYLQAIANHAYLISGGSGYGGMVSTDIKYSNPTSQPNMSGSGGRAGWTGVIDSATGKKQYLDSDGTYSYHANGGDFIVPPGFPNDSYKMGVQSGEHVQVTPAGQSSSYGGPSAKDIASELVFAMKRAGAFS